MRQSMAYRVEEPEPSAHDKRYRKPEPRPIYAVRTPHLTRAQRYELQRCLRQPGNFVTVPMEVLKLLTDIVEYGTPCKHDRCGCAHSLDGTTHFLCVRHSQC